MPRPRPDALALAAVVVTALALASAVAVGGAITIGGAVEFPETVQGDSTADVQTAPGAPGADSLIQPGENGSLLWPYTSKERSVEGRTLAINVVVHGEHAAVRRSLTDRGDRAWNRTDENETEADADTHSVVVEDGGVEWSGARGSTRYSYVVAWTDGWNASESGDESEAGDGTAAPAGRWVRPDYQLHSGSYLGTRQHVRAYESPRGGDDWTAIQAHGEYWDWFRLRHTVTSVKGAALTVEREYVGEPYVSEVRREYRGNRGGGNDGWITAVELAAAALAVGALSTRRRTDSTPQTLAQSISRTLPTSAEQACERLATALAEDGRKAVLPLSLLALYLGVRAGGVGLEHAFPGTSPKLFAGLLYPVIALGLPISAALAARPLDATAAFALAVGGLGAAFVLDFSTLGLVAISVRLALHRVALLVSLGLVAAGSASAAGPADRRALALGVVGWVVCLLLPLFGML